MNDTKNKVLQILLPAFRHNKSVLYIAGADESKISTLLGYCYDCCAEFGKVYLHEETGAAALVFFPHQKRNTLKAVCRDLIFVLKLVYWGRIHRVLKREKKLKPYYTEAAFYHLWYVGVHPQQQQKGSGTKLLQQIINEANSHQLPLYLETSEPRNCKWYEQHGFAIQQTIRVAGINEYTLHCYKKTVSSIG